MAKLLYQGHGSFRLTADNGMVIYVDPYAGEGYDVPADLILVTHQHGDHNKVELVTKNPGCGLITNTEALASARYNTFTVGGATIRAVAAYNKNHSRTECVGYIITIDGVKLYASGDTSKTDQMQEFAALNLDYALLATDGVYNMDIPEAEECAKIIAAKHTIPIHIKPGALFDRERAETFNAENRLILEPGQEIRL